MLCAPAGEGGVRGGAGGGGFGEAGWSLHSHSPFGRERAVADQVGLVA